jgi:hypothetical protein
MALVVADRVQETATPVTTVSFTLGGAVTGFRTFSAGIGANNTTYYSSTDASGNWEVGLGTLDSLATTLTRTTILSSSNSGSAVTFSGTVNVFVTYPASKAVTSTVGIAQGGTGQTTYTDGQLLIGNSTGNTLTKATLTAGTNITITNGNGSISIAASGGGSGTVTSVGWTGGIVSVGTSTTTPAFTIAGTSGGIPYFSSGTTWASSGALTANAIVLGGGAAVAPTVLGSLGTTSTVLHGNASGAPSFGAVSLTTDVSGILPSANGGTGNGFANFSGPATSQKTFTLPNATCSILTNNAAVTVGQGGTGATTASAGFNALSPITTTGDLIIGNGTNSATRLAIGSNNYVLTSNGTTASWTAPSSGVLAQNTQVFTSGIAATYTAPANTQWVKITVVGPGGSGGNGTSARGTGGSAGGVAIKWLAMTAGQTLTYTVGTATTQNSTVSSGTLTISTITANSGTAGTSTAYANSSSAGPTGGTATGGDVNITGGSGGNSYGSSTTVATNFSGKGGDCPGFGSGGGSYGSSATSGQAGVGYGAGGGGSHGVSSTPGGAPGIIIFEAY